MQSTPTLPESKLSRPIDLRAIKRGDYRLATLGVTASELLRILKALRACNNASRSTARHVTITQASSGFLVSAVAGPISLTTVTQVALPADTFVLTAERGSLIRAARRVSPESRPHLTYGKRFFALSDGARRSHVQPHLPPSTLPRSPSPFATPTAILTHTSAPDLCAVQAFVDRYPQHSPESVTRS
ncbi:hypothetical protein Bpfe_031072 [Biomphalaria pfeifferi]|uniref:Uncharacterized protein n=1 Tax=Biomphalaria pfeifferi TaxID=112525 RepID=A0AAD8ETL6_BIOPF|nr:hypothetical protein Bpfe_031072 [Biomphalaria pfeifferi]